MAIINRLWQKVWDQEESKKRAIYDAKISRLYKLATEERDRLTPIQEQAMKMGGPEQDSNALYNQALNQANQQAKYQQMALAQQAMLANQTTNLWTSGTTTNTASTVTVGSGGTIGVGIAGSTGSGASTVSGSSGLYPFTTSALPSHSHTLIPPHAHTLTNPTWPAWPVLGDSSRDVFFMALKGIEEAAMKKPEYNHAYDDLALGIQDLRYFNPKSISLLGLTSFCLSNVIEVEPLITLLEGYGMVIE